MVGLSALAFGLLSTLCYAIIRVVVALLTVWHTLIDRNLHKGIVQITAETSVVEYVSAAKHVHVALSPFHL